MYCKLTYIRILEIFMGFVIVEGVEVIFGKPSSRKLVIEPVLLRQM